ncbi:hypothetical protein PLESTB_001627400 [Pleodorina starrii]|uniref:PPM-type phosphatase domain-containing protein n=1 Tax=Pleodorina starrii TaxID=330485 RepID=A0A9W6BZC8_9CHLO|nr:hypothetical protein PLESTB_001627400 [Pleodorina starrii]
MSRQNQRYQSPFGGARKQSEGLNSQTFLSGTGVQAALGGLGYGVNGRPLQNGANGIPYLQPSIFANGAKTGSGRMTSDPPTPTAGNSNGGLTAGGRPSAQTPGRNPPGTLASPKLGGTFSTTNANTITRKSSGNGTGINNTAPAGTLAGIARMVASTVGGGGASAGGPGGLSVMGAATRGGPGGGLSSTLPAGRTANGVGGGPGQAGANGAGASRPATSNGMTSTSRTAPAVPGLTFSVGSNQSMGSRGYQEDYRAILDTTAAPGVTHMPNMLLGAAVYDGHGGKQVSHWLATSYCMLNRAMEAVQQLVSSGGSPNDVAAVLEDVFVTCGNAAIATRMTAGSCVAMALLVQAAGVPWVLSANVGDSRTIMVSWDEHDAGGRPEATQLSVDHKLGPAKISEETRRVQAAGGTVIQLFGTWRIDGSLAVARAIGDSEFSRYVSSRPTVHCRQLMRRDRWLIIASDGLWDVMTNEEVAMFCRAQQQLTAAKLSEALVREALQQQPQQPPPQPQPGQNLPPRHHPQPQVQQQGSLQPHQRPQQQHHHHHQQQQVQVNLEQLLQLQQLQHQQRQVLLLHPHFQQQHHQQQQQHQQQQHLQQQQRQQHLQQQRLGPGDEAGGVRGTAALGLGGGESRPTPANAGRRQQQQQPRPPRSPTKYGNGAALTGARQALASASALARPPPPRQRAGRGARSLSPLPARAGAASAGAAAGAGPAAGGGMTAAVRLPLLRRSEGGGRRV